MSFGNSHHPRDKSQAGRGVPELRKSPLESRIPILPRRRGELGAVFGPDIVAVQPTGVVARTVGENCILGQDIIEMGDDLLHLDVAGCLFGRDPHVVICARGCGPIVDINP